MSVEFDEIRTFLAAHEPFSRLPEEELAALPQLLTMRYIRRGDVVVDFGAVNDTLHIIRSGAIDIIGSEGEQGTEVLLDRRDPGLTFGYSTLMGDPESKFRMQAVEDSLVLEFPREHIDAVADRNPDLKRFFSSQSRQIRSAADELANDSSNDVLRTLVGEFMVDNPLSIGPEASIREAAQAMVDASVSSLLVTKDDALLGIITDVDMRKRVVAAGLDSSLPITEIMTSELVTVSSQSLTMEAMLHMAERGIHHIPVVDEGKVVGIITQTDIARRLQDDPIYVTADLSRRESVEELAESFTQATQLAARYIERGASPQEAAGMITTAADALARRLFVLGEQKFGKAPVDYAFVAVGSQGRREMALASDQDNALVLANDYDEAEHGEYFANLTEFVCRGLDAAGQTLCPGEMMAMMPQWRMTVDKWISTFNTWVTAPEPDALLNAQIFFDFRVIYGNQQLGDQVHDAAVSMARGSRRLHAHLASLAARREPPLTFFRGIVVERSGEYANTLDVKKGGTAGIVQMARLYALSAGVSAVDTRERLKQSAGLGVSAKGAQDLLDAFNYLRSISLKHQARQLREGLEPDYHIDPKALGRMDREHLRDSFQIIKSLQNALATKYPVRNI